MSLYVAHLSLTGQLDNSLVPKVFSFVPRVHREIQTQYPRSRNNQPKKTLQYLSSIISSFDERSLGIQYVYGLEKFYCVLCVKEERNKEFHMNLIGGHVTGNSHRLEYCKTHFPELSVILEDIHKKNHHGLLKILLDLIASEVKKFDNSERIPTVIHPNLSDFNKDSIANHLKNLDHVNQHTQEGLERALIDIVLKNIEQDTINTSKDVNVNVSKLERQRVKNSQCSESFSSLRASQFNDGDINVVSVFNNFELLRYHYNFDAYKFNQLYPEVIDLKSEGNLLQNEDVKIFILTEWKKIENTEFENGSLKNLVEYTKFMIDTLIPEADSLNVSVQMPCPDPPSGDIFSNYREEKENEIEPGLPIIQLSNLQTNLVTITSSVPLPTRFFTQAYNLASNSVEWCEAVFVGVLKIN